MPRTMKKMDLRVRESVGVLGVGVVGGLDTGGAGEGHVPPSVLVGLVLTYS